MRSIFRLTALRSARACQLQGSRAISRSRAIHSTSRVLATETPEDPFADPAFKSFRDKVQGHQGAVDAMLSLGKIMESKGYDTTKKPSMTQMAKMAMDSDLRQAAQSLMAELQKAGVDPQEAMAMFQRATSKP